MGESCLTKEVLEKAVEILKKGGLIVYPTDTAYAIGGDFENEKTIKKILKLKKRTDDKFTLVAASDEQVRQFFYLHPKGYELANQYWPGPLSIAVNEKVAIRVPKNEIARQITEAFGKPLIATSANVTDQPQHYKIEDVQKEIKKRKIGMWIDGGELPEEPSSTIVGFENDKIKIIRQGKIELVIEG